ncbi:hypothetical protein DVJ78_02800 [Humibacter sp. BT305]|nr:hypothetical protein DVJ78_02800 [Humibacter sp. BT305]
MIAAGVGGAGAASAAIVKPPIELVSHDIAGGYGDADSDRASASSGMQSIAFISSASDLDAPSNGDAQVYVRDRASGRLELITVGTGGKPAVGDAQSVAISADGQKVAFTSAGADIIPGLTPGVSQAYLHDRSTGQTILLSHDAMGEPSSKQVRNVDIDDAGDTVSFDTAGELTSVTGKRGRTGLRLAIRHGPDGQRGTHRDGRRDDGHGGRAPLARRADRGIHLLRSAQHLPRQRF